MSDRGPVDAIGKRPGDPIGPAPGSIAAHNMETLRLRLKEYHLHERFMVWKMNEWPESLQEHVKAVCGEVGMCGDVIAESVAGWIRGDRDGEMPGMTDSPKTVRARISVAVDDRGNWTAESWDGPDGRHDTQADPEDGEHLVWVIADIPLPQPREEIVVPGAVVEEDSQP